jgi:hypothetical protein
MNFVGKPVAFVGKIEKFEDQTIIMKTHEGKLYSSNLMIEKRDKETLSQ